MKSKHIIMPESVLRSAFSTPLYDNPRSQLTGLLDIHPDRRPTLEMTGYLTAVRDHFSA